MNLVQDRGCLRDQGVGANSFAPFDTLILAGRLNSPLQVILPGYAVDATCLLAFTAGITKMPVPIGLQGRRLASAWTTAYSSSMTTLV